MIELCGLTCMSFAVDRLADSGAFPARGIGNDGAKIIQ